MSKKRERPDEKFVEEMRDEKLSAVVVNAALRWFRAMQNGDILAELMGRAALAEACQELTDHRM